MSKLAQVFCSFNEESRFIGNIEMQVMVEKQKEINDRKDGSFVGKKYGNLEGGWSQIIIVLPCIWRDFGFYFGKAVMSIIVYSSNSWNEKILDFRF